MTYNFKDKKTNIALSNQYMLVKTLSMFEWEGLPQSMPAKELELALQKNGLAFVAEHGGKIYAFSGALGGECDAYGNPKQFIVSNPWLNLNKTFSIENDGVLIRNDDLSLGLIPIFDKYNSMLIENDINMTLYGYNTRLSRLISASDDATKGDAQRAVNKIIEGEISVIGESAIFDGMKVHNQGGDSGQSLKTLIEFQQYLKATLNNEIGIAANTNLKRERLLGAEVEQNEQGLFSLVYSMAKCRYEAVEKLNKFFKMSILVGFGSVWKDRQLANIDGKVNVEENTNSNNSENDFREDQQTEEVSKELQLIDELLDENGITPEEVEILLTLKKETSARLSKKGD
jgi:hypothetical protein